VRRGARQGLEHDRDLVEEIIKAPYNHSSAPTRAGSPAEGPPPRSVHSDPGPSGPSILTQVDTAEADPRRSSVSLDTTLEQKADSGSDVDLDDLQEAMDLAMQKLEKFRATANQTIDALLEKSKAKSPEARSPEGNTPVTVTPESNRTKSVTFDGSITSPNVHGQSSRRTSGSTPINVEPSFQGSVYPPSQTRYNLRPRTKSELGTMFTPGDTPQASPQATVTPGRSRAQAQVSPGTAFTSTPSRQRGRPMPDTGGLEPISPVINEPALDHSIELPSTPGTPRVKTDTERVADWLKYHAPKEPMAMLPTGAVVRLRVCEPGTHKSPPGPSLADELAQDPGFAKAQLENIPLVVTRTGRIVKPPNRYTDEYEAIREKGLKAQELVHQSKEALRETRKPIPRALGPNYCW